MVEVWTLEQDEELRAACERAGGDLSLKKVKWWEELARGFPGSSAKSLQQRWMHIRNLPGLEYKTFAGGGAPRASSGTQDQPANQKNLSAAGTLATKASYGGQRTAGRNERANAPAALGGGGPGSAQGQAGLAAARRPFSASAVRISATRQSAVGQLRGAALASSHTPLLAFSKGSTDKNRNATAGGVGIGGPSAFAGSRDKTSGGGEAGGETGGGGEELGGGGGQVKGKDVRDGIDKDGGAVGAKKSKAKEGDENLIVIHVCDENRGINRDFTCRKDVLLAEMAYFRSYLNGSESCDDIDISVHCDIQIFQWLIKYLNEPGCPPPLDTTNVISILISSQFLKMSSLVDMCLAYVCGNLNEILKMPIDLNCLNQELLWKLSSMLSVDVLDELHDRKDKLVSRIYMRKLEELLLEDDKMLTRCSYCGKLFALCNRRKLACPKAKIYIDFHGNMIAEHVPTANWDMNKFLLNLRARKLSWREIYWKVWGIIATLRCTVCKKNFPAAEMGHCAYCSTAPVFRPGQNHGVYPCCNSTALRFDSSGLQGMRRGCRATEHQVDTSSSADPDSEVILAMATQRMAMVCTPFKDNRDGIADMLDEGGSEEDDAHEDEAASDFTDSEDESVQDPSRRAFDRSSRARGGVGNQTGSNINGRKRKAKRGDRAAGGGAGGGRSEPKDQRNFRQEIWREEDQRRLAALASLTEDLNSNPTTSASSSRASAVAPSTAASSKAHVVASQPLSRNRPTTSHPANSNSISSSTQSGGSRQPQRPTPARPATASTLKRGTSQTAGAPSASSRNASGPGKP